MNDKSTMNKIMEYMALGRPIVQFDLTEGRFSAQEASLYARKNDEVDFAENADETIEKYSKSLNNGHPFDAVLIDLTINGEIQGIEAIEKLKELNPDVVGILSTGYLNNPVINEYEEHGFSDLLHKPYDMKELSKALSDSIKE